MLQILVVDICGKRYDELWKQIGILTVSTSLERVRNFVNEIAIRESVFDAVVIRCTAKSKKHFCDVPAVDFLLAMGAAEALRSLPTYIAMPDGKRWCSIPVLILTEPEIHKSFDEWGLAAQQIESIESRTENHYGGDIVKQRVAEHRLAMIADFDRVGLIVQYELGRYLTSFAFACRRNLETKYYFGTADRRPRRFSTLHRDNFGIQVEVEAFEFLINRPRLREQQLQIFFERHPHFLSVTQTLLPQVRLSTQDGRTLIPDIVLKPIATPQRDSRWKLLELKLPQARLLTGKGTRARLSCQVMTAIRQLREYYEYVSNPVHEHEVVSVLGHPLKSPRLGILIGRLANTDVGALEREQRFLSDVKIVTYDEILEQQRSMLVA
jgi:hypothetical protein